MMQVNQKHSWRKKKNYEKWTLACDIFHLDAKSKTIHAESLISVEKVPPTHKHVTTVNQLRYRGSKMKI